MYCRWSLEVHIARVPVARFGYALRAPVSPDAELGVLVPLRRVVLQQRIPCWLEGASSGRGRRSGIPSARRPRIRPGTGSASGLPQCRSFPGRVIQLCLDDFPVAQFVEDSLVGRQCAEAGVVLRVLIEAGGQLRGFSCADCPMAGMAFAAAAIARSLQKSRRCTDSLPVRKCLSAPQRTKGRYYQSHQRLSTIQLSFKAGPAAEPIPQCRLRRLRRARNPG